MSGERTAVLLVAAGLSSRMGAFKPLLQLGDKPLIGHTLDTYRDIEAVLTVIVTGYQSEGIEKHFADRDICFIRNERYAETEMFDSIRLGLGYLYGKCRNVFVCPADIPLVRPFTVGEMLSFMQSNSITVLKPSYRGKSGHPLLIDASRIPGILSYQGRGGLKGALDTAGFGVHALPLPDPGILMDADTPEGMALIKDCYKRMDIPDRELSMDILEWRCAGKAVINHCAAVAMLAEKLARRAIRMGYPLSLRLVEAGALLHDVERASGGDHAKKGSVLLKKMGYPQIADIAGAHMDLPDDAIAQTDERAIVYLADKLTCGAERVTIKARMESALAKFAADNDAADSIRKRMRDAQTIMEKLALDDAASLHL